MKETYAKSLELTLAYEGGYSNHPKDPGGATMRGVTQATYDLWRRRHGLPARDVRQIEDGELAAIYRQEYADKVAFDILPAGLDYAVFDYAVNSGPGRAIKDLQRVLGVGVDGVLGQETFHAIADCDAEDAASSLCGRRLAFMKSLKTWSTFGAGWQRRVMGKMDGFQPTDNGVIDYAVVMARAAVAMRGVAAAKPELAEAVADAPTAAASALVAPVPIGTHDDEAGPAKADPSEQSVAKTKIGTAALVAGGGEAARTVAEVAGGMHEVSEIATICITLVILAALAAVFFLYREKLREQAIR